MFANLKKGIKRGCGLSVSVSPYCFQVSESSSHPFQKERKKKTYFSSTCSSFGESLP
jgi:hypothetical protein